MSGQPVAPESAVGVMNSIRHRCLRFITRFHARLTIAAAVGVLITLVLGNGWVYEVEDRPLIGLNIGWIAFSGSYLAITGVVVARSTPESTRQWALHEQHRSPFALVRGLIGEARSVWFVVVITAFSVIAAVLMIRSEAAGDAKVILGAASVVLSWVMLQTSFTLHYAFTYHNDGGMTLDHEASPDLWDFAYIAFTIGTSFTIVDASVTSRRLRRIVLGHSLLSFGYNTVLLGMVVTFLAR